MVLADRLAIGIEEEFLCKDGAPFLAGPMRKNPAEGLEKRLAVVRGRNRYRAEIVCGHGPRQRLDGAADHCLPRGNPLQHLLGG